MIKVAIIGAGGIGRKHASCYNQNPHTEVVAICDMVEERAVQTAESYGCAAFTSVAELLASHVKIDTAGVCTAGEENGSHHYRPTIELLEAGIPVLGEKPISNNIAEAQEMVILAQKRGLPYGINLNHRFTPAAVRARHWIDQGRIGQMSLINMRMWINNKKESSEHFHMRALHPHSFDIMRYFAGEVKKVHAFFRKGEGRKIWSNVQVNLLFESGAIGHLLGSYDGGGPGTLWGLESCEIVGSQARIVIEEACEKLIFSPRFSFETECYQCLGGMRDFGETFQSRIDAWVDDLRNETPPERVDAKAEDALKVQLIIEAAIRSWSQGTVEAVEII